jgi:hypothetical protein
MGCKAHVDQPARISWAIECGCFLRLVLADRAPCQTVFCVRPCGGALQACVRVPLQGQALDVIASDPHLIIWGYHTILTPNIFRNAGLPLY